MKQERERTDERQKRMRQWKWTDYRSQAAFTI